MDEPSVGSITGAAPSTAMLIKTWLRCRMRAIIARGVIAYACGQERSVSTRYRA